MPRNVADIGRSSVWWDTTVDSFATSLTSPRPSRLCCTRTTAFDWGASQQAAFDALKRAMTNAPVLILPDTAKPYTVTTDASDFAIGATLSQETSPRLQPIAFLSKKLLPAEMNYPVHDREMLSIICALKEWRHYLHGAEVHHSHRQREPEVVPHKGTPEPEAGQMDGVHARVRPCHRAPEGKGQRRRRRAQPQAGPQETQDKRDRRRRPSRSECVQQQVMSQGRSDRGTMQDEPIRAMDWLSRCSGASEQ